MEMRYIIMNVGDVNVKYKGYDDFSQNFHQVLPRLHKE